MTIQELEAYTVGWYYDSQDQLKNHIYRRSKAAFAAGDAARDAISGTVQLKERQAAARESFLRSIGGLPTSDTPLSPEHVGTVEGDGFRIEKIIFQSRPGHYVTSNLYLPDGLTAPRAAVLFLCGHHEEAKHVREYQRVCQYLVQAGLIVLAQDPIGQGERQAFYEPAIGRTTVNCSITEHEHLGMQCLPLGQSLARYFLHDAIRGLDYLVSRDEVDSQRIGVTGNSGGGLQTAMMMLADERIAAAAPGTFIMNRETFMLAGSAQDAEQIWPGWTAEGFDHEDIILTMAPRPVRTLSVKADFFPIEGTRRTVERCQRFWEMTGAAGALDLVEDESTHKFTTKLARAATEFFAKHLLETTHHLDDSKIKEFEPSLLWCTQSGHLHGERADARFVDDSNQQFAGELEGRRAASRHEISQGREWLRNKVMSHRLPCDLNPRFNWNDQIGELCVETCFWFSQRDIINSGYVLRHYEYTGKQLPVTVVVWDGGTTNLQANIDWIRATCRAGRAVLIINVSGAGALMAKPVTDSNPEVFFNLVHKLGDDLLWLGDDLAALRTYDVVRALDMIEQWPNLDASDIVMYARGKHGVYGRFAAALDSRVRRIEHTATFPSYFSWVTDRHYDNFNMKSVILHGMLEHFDLPDLDESS